MRFKNILNRAGSFGLAVLTAFTICPTSFTQAAEPESEVVETSVTSSAMVYINESEYGVTTVNDTEESLEVISGETVKIKVSANEGYQVSAITVASTDDLETFEVYAVDDHYEFVMPETDVYVTTWYETTSKGEEESSSEEDTLTEETITEETEIVSEEDTTEVASEPTTEVQEEIVDIYASDFDFSSVEGIDFSSGRLLVAGDDSIFVDRDVIVSSYDGLYILQFTDIETAKRAYGYYSDKAAMVIVDTAIYIADDADINVDLVEETSEVTEETPEAPEETEPETATIIEENPVDESLIMSEGDTPFDELKEALNDGVQSYDIALIDTGASNVTSAYSVIGDVAYDDNGHGTKMVDAIYGQNQGAKILSIKAADANGRADVSAIYAAFEYAISQNVKIINLSMSAIATSENAIIVDEIEKAISMGITVVGAAGNNAANAAYFIPGKIDSAFIIGAADETGIRLSTSNFGDTVDYNVYAESTSEAAATFAGWISTNELSTISDVLNKDLIFETEYDGIDNSSAVYTLTNDFIVDTTIDFPQSIIGQSYTLGQGDMIFYTTSITGSATPVYCVNRGKHRPDNTYLTLTNTQMQQVAYCIAHGYSINRKDDRFAGIGDQEAQYLTQIAVFAVLDPDTLYNIVDNINSSYTIYNNVFGNGNFQKAVDLYNEAITYSSSAYNSLARIYKSSDSARQDLATGYSAGATLTKSANVNTGTYPLTGGLYSVYNANEAWMGSFVTDSDGTGYVASYTTNKSDTTGASIVVQYGDGYYYSYKSSKILPLGTGTYTVYEKVAPNRYALNTSGYTFTISASNPYIDLTSDVSDVFRDIIPGAVTLKKSTDANTQEYPLTGALYSVCKSGSEDWAGAFLTDADGTGYVAAYTTDESVATGASIYVQYDGAYFYTNKESKSLSLDAGSYVLKERLAPSCYALNTDSTTFTIPEAVTKTLTSKDTLLLGTVTLTKSTSADTSKYPLTGALYSIYTTSDTWVGSFITGAGGTGYVAKYTEDKNTIPTTSDTIVVQYGDGWYYADDWATTLPLKAGTYKVLEKVAPAHYALHSDSYTFEVNSNEIASLTANDSGILEDPLLDGQVQITKSVETLVGHINLTKTSANTSITDNNDCYSLEGAVYGIYADKDCQEEIDRITTNAEGKAASADIEIGTYYVKEITASKGYTLDTAVYTVNVRPTGATFNKAAVYTVYSGNTAVGTLACDATTGISNILTLADGTYTLKETTPASGYALNNGVYEFEIIAGELITLTSADTAILSDAQETQINVSLDVTETPLSDPGQVRLMKKSAEDIIYIEGAVFKVEYFDNYNTSGTATRTWYYKTDSTGLMDLRKAQHLAPADEYRSDELYYDGEGKITFPLGSIRATEVYAPEGYILLSEPIVGTIKENDGGTHFAWVENGQARIDTDNEVEVYDDVKYGNVTINKEDIYTTTPEGDASFDGIEVTIYNNSGKSVYIPESDKTYREVKDQEAVGVLVFENGESSVSTGDILPLGVYIIKETSANESYLLNEEWSITATLTDDGSNVLKTTYENDNNTVQNTPARGGVKVQKINEELGTNENEGLSSLKDCIIAIVNASDAEVCVDGNIYQTIGNNSNAKDVGSSDFTREELIEKIEDAKTLGENVVVKTITTDENGVATTEGDLLPYGTYYLYEVSANGSMQIDEDWVIKVEIRENGVIVDTSETPIEDPVVRGDLFFEKTNETGYGKPNIPFLLVSYDKDGNAVEAHVIVTGAEGYTDTAHYYISDDNGIHMVDRDNTYMTNGFDSYVKYNASTGEYYVTAEGETLLESGEAAKYGIWFSQGVDPETGELTKATATPDNSRGALYYGNYKLFEIKCNDNASKGENLLYSDDYIPINQKETTVDENGNIIKEISDFLVRSSKRFQNLEVELTSEALDVTSSTDSKKSHVTFVKDDVQLSDTISYTHLESTTEYKWVINFVETDDPTNVLSTVTIDRYKPVKQSDTEKLNTTFGEFTISTDGNLTNADCSNEPIITTTGNIDTRGFEGKSISAVVYLYEYTTGYDFENEKPSTIEVLNFIKSHNTDCGDKNEIVYVPSMKTTASDKNTADHVGTNVGTTAIIDKVSMTNIGPMEYYLLVETIMDKDTGEVFAKTQQLTQTFYADRNNVNYIESYEVDMGDLEINSEDLAGAKTLVAYEELWRADKDGNKIDEYPMLTHEDLLDEDETIWYPSIFTNASDLSTGDEVGTSGKETVIRDEVTYENLIENEEYVIKGKLVYQEDFVDANGVTYKAGDVLVQDGKECTAETTLTANEHGVGGSVTLEFTIDSSMLEGATLVAFEELYHNDVKVAVHADISDKAQTVHIPKIRTVAVDSETKDHVGSVFGAGINSIRSIFKPDTKEDQMQVIVDTVELTNLVPGKTYTVNGVLMDKTTGAEILVDGKPVTRAVNITVSEDAIVADGGEVGIVTMFDEAHNRVDGTVTITYSIDSASLMKYGTDDETKLDIVVFEDLVHNDTTVASHSDLTDEDQSIRNASIDTTASDKATKDRVGDTPRKAVTVEDVEDELSSTITDIVFLDGLVVGEEYTVIGQLVLRDDTITSGQTTYLNTNGSATDDALEAVSAVTTFIADAEAMDISLNFEVSSENVAGKTIVVYEKLFHNEVMITLHCDPYDEDETIYYPDVCTTAADGYTTDKVGTVITDGVFYDSVKCTNLIAGETYAVGGMLKYESDVLDENDRIIHHKGDTVEDVVLTEAALGDTKLEISNGKATFVAPAQTEENTTTITLKYELNTEKLNGHSLVAIEELYHNDVVVATHADMDDETQTVHYPNIYTNASDISTGDDVGTTLTETTILDEVTYENLLEDEEYVIKGKLVYQEDFVDVNGVEHKAGEVVVVPSYSEKTLIQEAYDEPISKVVYTCECGNTFESRNEVELHQSESGCTTGSWKSITEYVHHDAVYDVVTTDAYECIAETTLAAGKHTTDGTVTLDFTVNGNALKGATLVAFEELYHDDVKVTAHADIDDTAQTIHFPEIHTTAVDGKTQDHVGSIFGSTINAIRRLFGEDIADDQMQVITDTVTLKNLVPGRTYTINGYLIDKSTGLAVTVNEEPVTKTVNFTVSGDRIIADNGETGTVTMFDEAHNRVDGTVTITYRIDSAALMNYGTEDEINLDTVVFEFLIHNGTVVARHSDLTDETQSVYNASIKTVATDKATGNHVGDSPRSEATAEDIEDELTSTITDIVSLNGLVVGSEYTVEGQLVLKDETNEAENTVYLNAEGDATDNVEEAISATTTFVADAENMDVTLNFEVTSEKAAGRTVVVYERLFHNGIMITLHCNPNDKAETIWYPHIQTTAFDVNTAKRIIDDGSEISLNDMSHVGVVGTTTISDIVEYHNLIADEEYRVEGRLVYTYDVLDSEGNIVHEAGDIFCDKDGNAYTASTVLNKGHLTQGIARINFDIDSSMLAGVTLTVEETLINGETTVATHADINDEAQQIYFPELIRTTLSDENENKLVNATEAIKLVDKVEYTNLVPGNTYKLNGVLMDKTTGKEALDDNGEKIISTVEFTPENTDGTAEVVFEFSGVSLAGTSLVAFETLYYNDVIVNVHADIDDEAQTVYLPKIETTLGDAKGNKLVNASKTIKLTDTVNYENLIAEKSYKLEGVLMDKTTGKEILDDNGQKIIAETLFTPKDANGSVEIVFEFSGASLAGKTVVAFETLYFGEGEIASHTDIDDEAQTVYIPKVGTTATFKDGSKSAVADADNIIVDKVSYSNIVVGETYIVRGKLMSKETGQEILINGKAITAETTFVAQNTNGEVTLEFVIPKESFTGNAVVFEELYLAAGETETLVGEHKDINDTQQTVNISTLPATGDTNITPFAIIGSTAVLLALIGIFVLIKRKKMNNSEK